MNFVSVSSNLKIKLCLTKKLLNLKLMAVSNNDYWIEFFDEYRNCPELWNSKSNSYKNKIKRNTAFLKLLDIYKNIDENATIASLKNKIHGIRTCYRRELKKVVESQKSGSGADEIYVPALWYFDILEFLKDNEIPAAGTTSLASDNEVEEIEEIQPYTKRKCIVNKDNEDFLRKAVNHLNELKSGKKKKDDAEIYAEGWALSFTKLSKNQQLYAKKAIDEILVLGQLNQLSLHNVTHSPICTNENSPFELSRSSTPLTPSTSVLSSHHVEVVLPNSSNNSASQNTSNCFYSLQDIFAKSQFSDTQ